jgi:predicted Zn-dependent peptidase
MYRDQPDHYVQELLTETLWPDQPLGRPLAGTPETLDGMDRPALLRFKDRQYIAANTLVAVAGRLDHHAVLESVARHLALPAKGTAPGFAAAQEHQRAASLHYLHKPVEQTHLAFGIRGFSRQDPRRYTLKLLSVILGENMSSRLFQVIRERHGLAYSIQSSCSYFADTGAFLVSAGLDSKRLERAVALILGELRKLVRQAPAATELRRAKDYAIGQMRLGLESTSNQMMWVGEQLLAYDRVETPDQIEQRLQAVTAEQIQQVAATLFQDDRLNAAVISPAKRESQLRGLLTFA